MIPRARLQAQVQSKNVNVVTVNQHEVEEGKRAHEFQHQLMIHGYMHTMSFRNTFKQQHLMDAKEQH